MTAVRRVAQVLLSTIFFVGGLDAALHPETKRERAAAVVDPLVRIVPGLDPVTVVRANAVVQVAAGGLLAAGKLPRLSAAVLVASLLPTTYAGHRFWSEQEGAAKAQHRIHFAKNLGLVGGLLLVLAQ